MKPSDCNKYPFNSTFGKAEHEIIALNIVKILVKTGDKFRRLSYSEYKTHRLKDGNFGEYEKHYFDQVKDYCSSAKKARTFSKEWT